MKKNKYIGLICLIGLISAIGSISFAETVDRIAAVVNDQTITPSQADTARNASGRSWCAPCSGSVQGGRIVLEKQGTTGFLANAALTELALWSRSERG